MSSPVLKAFVLCDDVVNRHDDVALKDLRGVGLSRFSCAGMVPARMSFWVYMQLADQKSAGEVRLSLMRADSGRRYFFRSVAIRHADAVHATTCCIRLFDCVFPDRGIYFLELWYDGEWLVDQRLEVF